MRRLIETLKIENGIPQNIELHEERMNAARRNLWELEDKLSITKKIKIPASCVAGTVKCRIIYSDIIHSIEYENYIIRNIKKLKIVSSDSIEYKYKWQNRSEINNLFEQRGDCDDIIILKNNMITDSSFANLVFYDGFSYLTPEHPLLKGIRRQKLLNDGKIKTGIITLENIFDFKKIFLINAMIDIDCLEIKTGDVYLK